MLLLILNSKHYRSLNCVGLVQVYFPLKLQLKDWLWPVNNVVIFNNWNGGYATTCTNSLVMLLYVHPIYTGTWISILHWKLFQNYVDGLCFFLREFSVLLFSYFSISKLGTKFIEIFKRSALELLEIPLILLLILSWKNCI